ncbi:MAG: biotin carboxylase N-terminal domain-containing protein [Acidimicrobiia bacterium]|nr:biotin carboxylase N-terminal domain-containing protein [Acidimicrobiia bacterium]
MRFSKILVANRGEIARRVFRTCRLMGVATVAVYSDADRHAPFVSEADEAIELPGAAPADTYLRGDLVIEAALKTGAQAIHPGYGFLAENAAFATACAEAGIIFIGPSPAAIASMGSKVEARRLMLAAGIPVAPGEEVAGLDTTAVAATAARVGYPILVKASAGGGGKGMRIVRDAAELEESMAAARREAQSAFGDDTLFLERYIEEPRHIEVQILGDSFGTVVSLFERECSIQRRHQKIIEESPSPAVDQVRRAALGETAVRAAEAVGYLGVGTVEFLLDPEGEFYFLEMNTRLQVEHPVTEMVTGLDLVRAQIRVAEGHPLDPEVIGATTSGHAIEARLYAEDPRHEFLPTTGTLHRFELTEPDSSVRLDTGVENGSEVSIHYDPLLAKVVVYAPTRDEAAGRLAAALARAQIHGLYTNRELLVRILRHPEFLAGRTDTHFLDRHDPAELGAPLADPASERMHALAAALAGQYVARSEAALLRTIPSGWRNSPSQLQNFGFRGQSGDIEMGYRFDRRGLSVCLGGEPVPAVLRSCSDASVEIEIDGVLRAFTTHRQEDTWYVDSVLGHSALLELPRFPEATAHEEPGSLLSPMPGRVVAVTAREGDRVAQGDVLVVIEAMKMEHSVRAPTGGVITSVRIEPDDQVLADQILIVVTNVGIEP